MNLKRLFIPGPAALVALMIVLPAGRAPLEANDLFFHLASGRWLLKHGEFPTSDPFSPTATAQAPHEWVWGVLCELSVHLLGGAGPKLLVAALVCALLAAFWKLLAPTDPSKSSGVIRIGFFGAALWTQSFTWYQERPFHLGHLAFVLWLLALQRWLASRTPAAMVLVVGLSLVWANLHGSWVIGPIVLAAIVIAQQRERTFDVRVLALLVGCTLVAALHPGVLSNLLYPLKHQLLGSTQTITEWAPLEFTFGFAWVLVAMLVAIVARTAVTRREGDLAVLLPAIALTLAAFWSRRHAPFAGMMLAYAGTRVFEGYSPWAADRLLTRWSDRTSGFVWPVLLLALVTVNAARNPRSVRESIDESWYPVAGLDELRKRPPGRVLTKFEWGGAVSALDGPLFQTYLDSRNDPYPPEIHEGYRVMRTLKPGWKDELAKFNPDYVLWGGVGADFSWPLVWALESQGWKRIAEDEVGVLLLKP